MNAIKECCGNCKFHQMNLQAADQVYCRRYPPQGFIVPQGQRMGNLWSYPALPRTWWCGEYLKELILETSKTV